MSRRLRRTKIVTTLGPATDRDNNLEKVIAAGANVVRMNFSHGTAEDHQLRADKVREIAAKLGRHVAILGDLQGPKIRVGKFEEGKIVLENGDRFILDAQCELGNQERVGLDYKELPKDSIYRFSWQVYVMSFLMAFFLYEKGFREMDFNFSWGYMYGIFFAFVGALLVLLRATANADTRKRRIVVAVQWLAYLWHLVCGVYYFWGFLQGAMYY